MESKIIRIRSIYSLSFTSLIQRILLPLFATLFVHFNFNRIDFFSLFRFLVCDGLLLKIHSMVIIESVFHIFILGTFYFIRKVVFK